MIISRFLRSQSTVVSELSNLRSLYRTSRLLSAGPDNVQESVKVEEAETLNMPPPPTEKLLVLGGSGFVGSHVCKEALGRGLSVCSLSRLQYPANAWSRDGTSAVSVGIYGYYGDWSGRTSVHSAWADDMTWFKGDLLVPDSIKDAFDGVTAVVSCVGGFGSNSHMYKINGTANINAIRAASEHGVKRFVYISATDFGLVNYLLRGYYDGKKAAEAELLTKFQYGGVILRPGFIHGTRQVGGVKLPLGIIGSPMEMVLQHAKPLSQLPLVGPVFLPPVNVISVAKVAVRGATDPAFPPGVVDVFSILRYGQ